MLDLFRTLPGILNDMESTDVVREAVVFAAWRRVVGNALAGHAVPLKLDDTKLSVAVSNNMWKRHLQDLCGQILFKVNSALGAPLVTFIDLQIDEPAVLRERRKTPGAGDNEDEFRREAESEVSPELMAAADNIADVDLRQQFLLAAGNCLVRRKRSSSKSRL